MRLISPVDLFIVDIGRENRKNNEIEKLSLTLPLKRKQLIV